MKITVYAEKYTCCTCGANGVVYPGGEEPECFSCWGYVLKDVVDGVATYTDKPWACDACEGGENVVHYVEDEDYVVCKDCNHGREAYMAALAKW